LESILDLCPEQFRLREPLAPRLEHGGSWVQIGAVVGYDPDTKTVYVTRTFTGEEVIENQAHFPGWVIMAGVLQQELVAQAAIQYAQFDDQYGDCLFTIVRVEAEFRQQVTAGTELMAICRLLTLPKPGTIKLGDAEGQLLTADGKLVMSAKIRFKVVLKSKTPLGSPQAGRPTEEG